MNRVLRFWGEFFTDLRIWWKYRQAAIKSTSFLTEKGLRVDWLGRIYTVINLPEEVESNGIPMVQQGWVLGQLKPINDILLQIGLADYSYPSISSIDGSAAYLVVMWPELDSLNVWRILANLIVTSLFGVLIWLGIEAFMFFDVIGMVKSLKA